MEDAATAEISRAQLWQWVHHGARMKDGRQTTPELVRDTIAAVRQTLPGGRFATAAQLLEQLVSSPEFPEFLTIPAYEHID
jgi:malate synthase